MVEAKAFPSSNAQRRAPHAATRAARRMERPSEEVPTGTAPLQPLLAVPTLQVKAETSRKARRPPLWPPPPSTPPPYNRAQVVRVRRRHPDWRRRTTRRACAPAHPRARVRTPTVRTHTCVRVSASARICAKAGRTMPPHARVCRCACTGVCAIAGCRECHGTSLPDCGGDVSRPVAAVYLQQTQTDDPTIAAHGSQ